MRDLTTITEVTNDNISNNHMLHRPRESNQEENLRKFEGDVEIISNIPKTLEPKWKSFKR